MQCIGCGWVVGMWGVDEFEDRRGDGYGDLKFGWGRLGWVQCSGGMLRATEVTIATERHADKRRHYGEGAGNIAGGAGGARQAGLWTAKMAGGVKEVQ
eukprot:359740-Chlamydomonas_euryale.AAC.14